jgi:IS1 family transposase
MCAPYSRIIIAFIWLLADFTSSGAKYGFGLYPTLILTQSGFSSPRSENPPDTFQPFSMGKHTVLRLLEDAGCACAAYHHEYVRNLRVRRVQCDEIWAFVGAKAKNATPEKEVEGWGDVWTWTAIAADTKLIISYTLGDRGAGTAKAFMQDVASRIVNRIQLTTDGHRVYADAVENAFGSDIDYAMLVKLYGASNDNPESRYSPATCIGCRTGILSGRPDPSHISTSYVERQNLSMRMGMRRFTRLTNGFSKKFENHAHHIALYFFHYNFCRVHSSLRVTPAMEAGLTDHVWTLAELCSLLPERKPYARIDKELITKALQKTA